MAQSEPTLRKFLKRRVETPARSRLLAHANPNPQRVGCLPREVLATLAAMRQPLNSLGYEHLLECSECYREFRKMQMGDLPDES